MSDFIRNIKGTKDILPDESFIWQFVESEIRSFLNQYGYSEIRTPAFENSILFNRSIGENTDIVSKEMYSWIDQGGNNVVKGIHIVVKKNYFVLICCLFFQEDIFQLFFSSTHFVNGVYVYLIYIFCRNPIVLLQIFFKFQTICATF